MFIKYLVLVLYYNYIIYFTKQLLLTYRIAGLNIFKLVSSFNRRVNNASITAAVSRYR
jgi:hypothetical protein